MLKKCHDMKEKEAIRIHVCCLKAPSEWYAGQERQSPPAGRAIGQPHFEDALYSLPSALADG
jgi:hypothetical protein